MARFTPGELSVMRLLWKHGEMKPSEIQDEFPGQIKNPALRSYLAILLEKAHVTRKRRGRAYYYRAKTRRHSAFRATLREMVDAYFDGSTSALLTNLLQSERLSAEELEQLQRTAQQRSDSDSSDKGERT